MADLRSRRSTILLAAALPVVVAAVFFVFDDESRLSIRVVTLAMAAGSAWILVEVIRGGMMRQFGKFMFVAAFLFWYVIPACTNVLATDVIGNSLGDVSDDLPFSIDARTTIESLLYCVLFFFAGILTSSWVSATRGEPSAEIDRREVNGRRVAFLAIGACLVGFVPYLVLGGGWEHIVDGIFGARAVEKEWVHVSNIGDASSPFTTGALMLMVGGAAVLFVLAQTEHVARQTRLAAAAVAGLSTLVVFFDQGTRSLFALIVLPAMVVFLARTWRRSPRRAILLTAGAAFAMFAALQFEVLYRSEWTRDDLSRLFFEEWSTLGGTNDFFRETLLSVKLVPEQHEFFHESVLLQFLVAPIPRFLWEGKPLPEVVHFYSLKRWGIDIYETGGNALPGVIGQYYMSWGWAGVVAIGAAFGLFGRLIDRRVNELRLVRDPFGSAAWIMVAVWSALCFRLVSPGFLYPVLTASTVILLARRQPPVENTGDIDTPSAAPVEAQT